MNKTDSSADLLIAILILLSWLYVIILGYSVAFKWTAGYYIGCIYNLVYFYTALLKLERHYSISDL